jgi:signal transduction histidine kinase/ligand-binding sensor domain-containing protein/DNA-binding response OmpR family regulator
MKRICSFACLICLFLLQVNTYGQDVFRFEHIGTEQGLSQNTGSSILFDSKGFMWIGTMNGLNRYDGYEFRIFKGQTENATIFTNNRVTRLWEDRKGFIWVETYDGYYHYFNPQLEVFSTVPNYESNVASNSKINSFLQLSDEIIILGSSNAGIFVLQYDPGNDTYRVSQYLDRGSQTLSNNQVRFVHAGHNKDIWIGTNRGLNLLPAKDIASQKLNFQHLFVNASFTTVCESDRNIWFGSEDDGIFVFNPKDGQFDFINRKTNAAIPSDRIMLLYHTGTGSNIVGLDGGRVMIADKEGKKWTKLPFHGNSLAGVYEDRLNQLWLTALEFGVTRVDLKSLDGKYYILTPEEIKHLTDLERPQFFEDRHDNLWIGLHGGGLALFHRKTDVFQFFRNDPKNPHAISSNIIHSIAEDNTGQLWLGTGQFLGGIEKVILENPAFEHFLLEGDGNDMLDNVVRAIMEDKNRNLWVGTKAGRIHVFDSTLKKVAILDSLPGIGRESVRNNTYSLFNDNDGYLWIGSKGDGLSVSTQPITGNTSFQKLRFRRYKYSPDDSTTLGNNNIYSICQDKSYNIWVGTYGNGISLIRNDRGSTGKFVRINQQNSNLSNNLVRHLLTDRQGNLWVATVLGLNLLEKANIDKGNYQFTTFYKNPSDNNSLSYNDVIHIFEDVKGRIWLGTFGGGVDLLERQNGRIVFSHFMAENELNNDVIFGILEDNTGNIWLSTENGLIRLNPDDGGVSLYNTYNGLYFSNFSENTCFRRRDNSLCFGGNLGFEVVFPEKLVPEEIKSRIELTNFLLFNKEVPVNQSGSPLQKNISFTDKIILRNNQSSFGLNFSALDFLDPAKINYAYILNGFEEEWNYVGNQSRATYTNLSPGKYTFRVKSLKGNDLPGSDERVLHILIRPPWWRTIIAYLTYLVMISLISLSIYKTAARLSRYRNELLVEKKVNELKLQFFTNISHEIRTPLTLIIGPIEDMLANQSIPPMNRTLMGIIHKNAKRMLNLTSQLLDFRKIQNNKMVLKIREIELISFARDIYESFIPLARHKGIRYTFHAEAGTFALYGDPSKIDTIIYNIISNAIKFTDQGKSVAVTILCANASNYVDICITDEGPGIPQKNLSDIFTRYTILSNRDLAGTGIGLSLSYELAKLHQGDILISSVEGEGSTFTIRLPKGKDHFNESTLVVTGEYDTVEVHAKHQEEKPEEITQEDNAGIPDITGKKQVMLIVEDNAEILNYICQALHSNFTCIGARNGEEGLHIAQKMNPDIIITDIMMPGMNGMEMTRQLKEDFNTCHIPVIMLTSKVGVSDQIAGIENGAEAYILKPFKVDYLKAVTRNLLNQRQKVIAHFTTIRDIGVEPLKVASRDEEFLRKVIQFIEDNYQNDFSIDNLAEHCCAGRTVFYNKIKGLTGFGPLEFVRKIKLKIASQLLEKGYNVSEVAYRTGFSDVKYFSKHFKAAYGFSPSKQKNSKVTG